MPAEGVSSGTRLRQVSCGLCGGDAAEPVAVGEDFHCAQSRDTYLAMRCTDCGLIYLNPVPLHGVSAGMPSPPPGSRAWRRVVRWASRLPYGATLVIIGPGSRTLSRSLTDVPARGWRVVPIETLGKAAGIAPGAPADMAVAPGSADGGLFIGTLEQLEDPVGALREVARLIRPEGRVLVISANPGSLAADVFRGRHWSGYDFPRRRSLADPLTLGNLVERAGFTIERLTTVSDPAAWPRSVANLLADWGAAPWVAKALGPRSPVTSAMAGLLEGIANWFGRGGLVEAVLRPAPESRAAR